jgi:heme-degrading monooxygenase HmoA
MHAVVVTVDIDPNGDAEAGLKNLREQVAPGVSQAPGFVSGVWLAPDDQNHGLSVVIFESEEAAKAGAAMAKGMFDNRQVPDDVTLNSIDVREVAAKA